MNNFSDFDIKPKAIPFSGDKVKLKSLLNKPIKVLDFKIGPSTAKPGTECLTIQLQKADEKCIAFTGSTILMDQIKRVPQDRFPFNTTIKQIDEYYEFT